MINGNSYDYDFLVDFTLLANKQKTLIKIIHEYSGISYAKLGGIMSLSARKIKEVKNGKSYFDKLSAKKLVQYFCICIGE